MKTKFSFFLFSSIVLTSLTGCETTGSNSLLSTQNVSTGAGAIVGGLIGNQAGGGNGKILTTIAGVAAGAWIGNQIGQYLSQNDQKVLEDRTRATLDTGKPQHFKNPETGVSAKTQLIEPDQPQEKNCKTVLQQVTLKDKSKRTQNVQACKINGAWKVMT